MFIVPMSPDIHTIEAVDKAFGNTAPAQKAEESEEAGSTGTFLDAMAGLWNQAAEAQAQKSEDMLNLMLGNTDNLEQLQINLTKAEISTELLVNVKNAVVDAYNEIMRMSI